MYGFLIDLYFQMSLMIQCGVHASVGGHPEEFGSYDASLDDHSAVPEHFEGIFRTPIRYFLQYH